MTEGASPEWRAAAMGAMEAAFAGANKSVEVDVIAPLIKQVLELLSGDPSFIAWSYALARAVWADLKVTDDGVRVPMAAAGPLGPTAAHVMWTPPRRADEQGTPGAELDSLRGGLAAMQTQMAEMAELMRASGRASSSAALGAGALTGTAMSAWLGEAGLSDLAPVLAHHQVCTLEELSALTASDVEEVVAELSMGVKARFRLAVAELGGRGRGLGAASAGVGTGSAPRHREAADSNAAGEDDENEDEKIRMIRARLASRKVSASASFAACVEDFRSDPTWPWRGTTRASRSAPEYLATVYQDGQFASQYVRDFLIKRGLSDSHEGDCMALCAEVLDQLMCHDGVSILNAAGCEVLSRRMMGLEQSLQYVQGMSHISKASNAVEWVDLVRFKPGPVGVDKEVRAEQRAEHDRKKWGQKVAAP